MDSTIIITALIIVSSVLLVATLLLRAKSKSLADSNANLIKLLSETDRIKQEALSRNVALHDELLLEANERMKILLQLQNLHNVSHEVFAKNSELVKTGTLLQASITDTSKREEIASAFANSNDLMNYIQIDVDNKTANLAVIKYTDLMKWFDELVKINYSYMQMFNRTVSEDEEQKQQ